MARPPKEDKEEKSLTASDILGASLKENKEWHLNFVEEIYYRVSTGSIMWDVYTEGGLPPGLHRFIGPPEAGKSSVALEVCRNFLKLHPNGRGLFIKAEGRLSVEMQRRSGLRFVYTAEEWVDGTIFVLESNVYEYIINLLRKLIKNPENKNLFCIIIDSMDGLQPMGDVKKDMDENTKVAGAPALTKRFMQSMANEMAKRGHMVLMTSQYSSNIQLDMYAAATDKRSKQGSGGWGAAHFANFAFELTDANQSDLIKEDANKPAGPMNKILGKRVKVRFKKSTNEKTGMEISYPVKYGVIACSSVWTGVEVVDVLKMFSLIKIAAWIDFPKLLRNELIEKIQDGTIVVPSIDYLAVQNDETLSKEERQAKNDALDAKAEAFVPEKVNGERKLIQWFDANDSISEYVGNKFRNELVRAVRLEDRNNNKEETEEENDET